MLRKLFRPKTVVHWEIIEKETVDEIIFRTDDVCNRLMLELMARGGMRVSEVLNLTPADILGRKLILNETKSGKEQEIIFSGNNFTIGKDKFPKATDKIYDVPQHQENFIVQKNQNKNNSNTKCEQQVMSYFALKGKYE